jgi:hypothetical protein
LDGHYYCKRHIDYETEHSIDKLQNDESIDKNRCNGISYEKKPLIYLYDEKNKLIEHMDYRGTYENKNRTVLQLPLDIEEKFFVPMNNTLKDKMEWFSGYCDADGCISNNAQHQIPARAMCQCVQTAASNKCITSSHSRLSIKASISSSVTSSSMNSLKDIILLWTSTSNHVFDVLLLYLVGN